MKVPKYHTKTKSDSPWRSLGWLGIVLAQTSIALAQPTAPGLPEANGLRPASATIYVNPPATTQNNGKVESIGVAVVADGNIAVAWEDDGDALADQEAVWTLFSPSGTALTPVTTITSVDPAYAGQTFQSKFLAYFRADGSAVSGRTAWGPKIKANLFGNGFGMGATAFDLGLEVASMAGIQFDAAGANAGDFPGVQLLNNAGGPLGVVSGVSEAYAERSGDIRIGDWDYLSNGNILIVGESRQRDDLVAVYGGAEAKTHGIYRIVSPSGAEVVAERLLGKEPIEVQIWHGTAVTANGFAVRYATPAGAKLRFFKNNGDPVGDEVLAADAAGSPIANGGGRGEEIGFNGNGKDAYVLATKGLDEAAQPQIWVAVFNADGSKRWARTVSDTNSLAHTSIGRVDAAIDARGRVAVVYADKAGTVEAGGTASLILGRLFDETGKPLGGIFHVSEKELPAAETLDAFDPRVDWRDNTLTVAWESKNLVADNPDAKSVVALRTFSTVTKPGLPEANGLTASGPTIYINPPATAQNNGKVESIGVAVVADGNIAVGWEDDGDALNDLEAVWTLYSPNGTALTPLTTITSVDPAYAGQTIQSKFLAYFRADGTAVSGRTAWGPKIKANLFGNGFGMGASAFDLGLEVASMAAIQFDAAGENVGDFPGVQLLNNAGGPLGVVSGVSDAYAERSGSIRIGDWDYLSDGNILIVGESRQRDDLISVYGGAESKTHGIYRIVSPSGAEVVAERLLGKEPVEVQIWHGTAVTANGFAVRYATPAGAKLRFFKNNGDPVGDEVLAADVAGSLIANGGGRGEEIGFNGNGKDAYVLATKGTDADGLPQIWVAVFNADGSKRWARTVNDVNGLAHSAIGRVDAAIDAQGRVVVVYADKAGTLEAGGTAFLVLGRVFDASGKPLGGTFHVSEKEMPAAAALDAIDPRVDFRNNVITVAWESKNLVTDNPDAKSVVALRTFALAGGVAPSLAIQRGTDGSLTITYSGVLEQADLLTSGFTTVQGASSPYKVAPGQAAGARFYRARN